MSVQKFKVKLVVVIVAVVLLPLALVALFVGVTASGRQQESVILYVGITESNLLSRLTTQGCTWTTRVSDGGKTYIVASESFDIYCSHGYVLEVNLYAPGRSCEKGYQRALPWGIEWTDSLEVVLEKMGKEKNIEEYTEGALHYVSFRSGGRRLTLVMTATKPSRLWEVRLQMVPLEKSSIR